MVSRVTDIPGVACVPLRIIPGELGAVRHALKRSDPGFSSFGEAYFSEVLPGSIKGWKRHRMMTLNLVVPVGQITFQLYDDRAATTLLRSVVLGREHYARLTVPPGIWVAFRGDPYSATNMLLNIASHEHDPAEAENKAFPGVAAGMPEVRWDEVQSFSEEY